VTLSAEQTGDKTITDWDGISGATVLDRLREVKQLAAAQSASAIATTSARTSAGSSASEAISDSALKTPWIWLNLAWLSGGLYLLLTRIISWHIPVSILATISVLYATAGFHSIGVVQPLIPALFSGAIMLGAFFIATDPVSAAASRYGQLLYGVGIGTLTYVIREFSVYPEGIAFAVLLMNLCVPMIDRLSTGKGGRMTLRRTH